MKLQRYYANRGNLRVTEPHDGDLILVRASEALDWFESLLDSHNGLAEGCVGEIPYRQRKSVQSERARLRAIIEAERDKV